MRSYFVTGGTGFIGRSVVRKLIARPDTERITVLTRGIRAIDFHDPERKVDICTGDIANCDFPLGTYTDIIHAAADANDLLKPDQYHYYYTLVEGTRRLLQWVRKQGTPNTLFLSSGAAVYRETVYGQAKRLCESMCDGSIKVVRLYSAVGEEMPMNGQYALGQFIYQAVMDKKVRYYGGTHVRSYLYIDDVADWILAALDFKGAVFGLDIGGAKAISIAELAALVGEVCGVPVERTHSPTPRGNESDVYLPHPEYTQKLLGVRETVTLKDAIRKVYDHVCHTHLEPPRAIAPFSLFDPGKDWHSSR